MRIVWSFIVVFLSIFQIELMAEDKTVLLSNGYSFIKTKRLNEYDEYVEKIKILKNNKQVREKENNHVSLGDEIFTENHKVFDINNDGIKEILFSSRSGGAHCCYETELLSLEKSGLKSLLKVDLENYSLIKILDLNNDKIDEVLIYDDSYSYIGDFAFSNSPVVEVIFEFKNGKYIFSEELMRIKKIDKSSLERSSIQVFLDYLYRGDYKKGIHSVKKETTVAKDELFTVEERFLSNFKYAVERAMSSSYWIHIKNMNGWNHYSNKKIKKVLMNEVKREFPNYREWL